MTRLSLLALAVAVALLTACGKSVDLPQKPQIAPDRLALTFTRSAAPGTCVGTQNTETPLFYNKGLDDLHITAITLTGPNANLFRIAGFGLDVLPPVDGTLPLTVPSNRNMHVSVNFLPTAAGTFTATLTLKSDAENAPTLQLGISAAACVCNPALECQ